LPAESLYPLDAPDTGRVAELVMLSKRVARILRHRPDSAGVKLDRHGWCDVDALLRGLAAAGSPVSRADLEQMVRDNDKQRFVLEGHRIRAAQGHSVRDVEPVLRVKKPLSRLFHGTVEANLVRIERQGLLPMRRHHVHLSADEATARLVGGRRGVPIVLVIDSARMERDGHTFFVSDNGVWLVDAVPPQYLSRIATG
jgi:putative RNA 2'-phosphotransferase